MNGDLSDEEKEDDDNNEYAIYKKQYVLRVQLHIDSTMRL